MALPFLKYPGGKRNIIESLRKYFPKKFNNYYEPFVGGGAVFFDIDHSSSILNDINKNIAHAYCNIRDNPFLVISHLKRLSNHYKKLTSKKWIRNHDIKNLQKRKISSKEKFYYQIRDEFNSLIKNKEYGPFNTSLLIFLNRTCFNGIYRENKTGTFNVPHGRYEHSKSKDTIIRANALLQASEALKDTEILSLDFQKIFNRAKSGDFFYIDPPYMPLSKTSSFTMYDKSGFDKKDQLRLRCAIQELHEKGCFFMFNNSDQPYVRELYTNNIIWDSSKFVIDTTGAKRALNSKGSQRGKVNELIITNY
jgi:DNA adenine methylase